MNRDTHQQPTSRSDESAIGTYSKLHPSAVAIPEFRPHHLLTDRDAPNVVGVKRKTLQEWRRLGKGPRFIRVSNRCFYRYSDLQDFLANCPQTVARRSRSEEDR